jgi:hypothetical protein
MRDQFVAWHHGCVTLTPNPASRRTLESGFRQRLKRLDLVASVINSADDADHLENLLTDKLSTEAVHKLVIGGTLKSKCFILIVLYAGT